jgi:hypothetical protein
MTFHHRFENSYRAKECGPRSPTASGLNAKANPADIRRAPAKTTRPIAGFFATAAIQPYTGNLSKCYFISDLLRASTT